MTHDEKINYMRIAAGIAGFGLKTEHLDLLVCVYELVLRKKGKANIEDVIEIERDIMKRTGKSDHEEILT